MEELHPVLSDRKALTMTLLMTPDLANFHGKVHGGHMLRFLDQVAYACASRYSGRYVVTVSVDQAWFRQAVSVGELVTFLANVNFTGRSTMEVGIKVIAEEPAQNVCRHVMSCFFTMCAVDENGKPTPVPPLDVVTDDDRRRFEAAKRRREIRETLQKEEQARKAQTLTSSSRS